MQITKEIGKECVKTPDKNGEITEVEPNRLQVLLTKYPKLESKIARAFELRGFGYWPFYHMKKGRSSVRREHDVIIDEIVTKYNLSES